MKQKTDKNKRKVTQEISPKEYRERVRGIELQDIRLATVKANIRHDLPFSPKATIDIDQKASYREVSPHLVEVTHSYYLHGRYEESKQEFLDIECTFSLIFESKHRFDDDFFEVFKVIHLRRLSWPYARELVDSLTARFHIRPLVLPLHMDS